MIVAKKLILLFIKKDEISPKNIIGENHKIPNSFPKSTIRLFLIFSLKKVKKLSLLKKPPTNPLVPYIVCGFIVTIPYILLEIKQYVPTQIRVEKIK